MNKKLIIAFVVFTAIGAGIFYFLTTGNIGVKYNTVEVKRGEMGKYVQDVGTVSSKNVSKYYGNGSLKVEEMTVELGDYVEKGQQLIRYEGTLDLEIQKIEKQIEALKATYNDVLSGTDMESVSSARIEVSRIKNQLETATKNKDRTETLYNNGAVPRVEYEQALNSVAELQSSLGVAQNTYNQLAKGISQNIRTRYEAEIDVLLLSMAVLEKNRENYVIIADSSGVITELNTFVGDIPNAGTVMIEIMDPAEKIVRVDFMVEDAIGIKPDQDAAIEDSKLNIEIEGLKVQKVYPKAFITLSELGVEENRQTVEVGLAQSGEALAFGLEVTTKVMVEPSREALLVPVGAVIQKDSKQYVKVLEGGDPVEKEITTGMKDDGEIEVTDGLEEGELVILNYQED